MTMRVGLGFDSHRFAAGDAGRALVLGGVAIEGHPGLVGHSDGDVIAHAVADALLGAAGLGDLGSHFPDNAAVWAGADSIELLGRVAREVIAAGWSPGNVDCAVVAEAPLLAEHRPAMERQLSDAVGAPVTVKAKRAEGMGALGRAEGMACWAVALLEAP